jgi:SAM-dependent methyltransferase
MKLSNLLQRVRRIATNIATLNFSPLMHTVWLRYNRIDYGVANNIDPKLGHFHAHSGGPRLTKVIKTLNISKDDVVLDLGVGKGIAAITLAHHFSLVIGVDLSQELIDIAEQNASKAGVSNIELHCSDVRDFNDGLERVTHVYMYNPFPASVMNDALNNLKESIRRKPRQITLIYLYPTCHDTVIAAGFTHRRDVHLKEFYDVSIYDIGRA